MAGSYSLKGATGRERCECRYATILPSPGKDLALMAAIARDRVSSLRGLSAIASGQGSHLVPLCRMAPVRTEPAVRLSWVERVKPTQSRRFAPIDSNAGPCPNSGIHALTLWAPRGKCGSHMRDLELASVPTSAG